MNPSFKPIEQLPTSSASTIKKQGWRGVMRALSAEGRLVVTNHNEPEAVILSTAEYSKLLDEARRATHDTVDPLQALRERFDARLSSLSDKAAGDTLRQVLASPATLSGAVKAGTTY